MPQQKSKEAKPPQAQAPKPDVRFYEKLSRSNPQALRDELKKFRQSRKLDHPLERTVQLTRESVDVEKRLVVFSFSSETPVERWGWVEILGHQPGEMDTTRMDASAPHLMDHDWDDQRGVVIPKSCVIRDGKGYVTCQISRSPAGEELLQDMADGIRVNVSVGYFVNAWQDVTPADAERDDPPVYRAISWTPFEVSSVAVPADISVGLGRALEGAPATQTTSKEKIMNEKQIRVLQARRDAGETLSEAETAALANFELGMRMAAPATAAAPVSVQAQAGAETRGAEAERKRVSDISAIVDKFPGVTAIADLSRKAIKEGTDSGTFNLEALEVVGKAQRVMAGSEPTNNGLGNIGERDLKKYSLIRAIRGMQAKTVLDGLEAEVHQELLRNGMEAKNGGVCVPWQVLASRAARYGAKRAMTAGSFSAGGALVETEAMEFVDLLRNKTKVLSMGAQSLSGLKGDIYFPRQTGASTMYWVAEAGSVTESDLSVGQIHLRPNTAGARTEFGRQLLIQSDPSVDGLISRDLMAVMGIGLDLAALSGTGVAGQPLGVINTTGVGSQSVSTASFANIVAFETKVAQANADVANMGWLANPAVRGTLKGRTQVSGGTTPPFIWDKDEMNGYRAEVTNQLTSSQVVLGDWSQLILAMWGGGVELKLVEFPTNYAAGNMELLAFVSADIAVRQVGAFCVGTNFS